MDKYQQTIDTFNHVADKYWGKFKDFKLYQPTYDWFLKHLPEGKLDLLEVACGPGNVSHYLLNKKSNVNLLGFDLAPNMVKLAQQHNPQAEFNVMDCRQIDSLDQSFDAIMCGFCLPYFNWDDSVKLIKDMVNLLLPGGLLYLSSTEGDSVNDGFKGSKSAGGAVYVHHHSVESIKALLLDAGLNIMGSRKISHLHNGQTTNDVFILANKPA